jgi:siroheme synthase-like protein
MSEHTSEMMRFLPVGLNLRGKRCLLVGGGRVATRKAATLLQAGAALTVVSPTLTAELAQQVQAGRARWLDETFCEAHLDGVFLTVAATDDEAVNAAVVRAAEKSGTLVCDASSAHRSEVVFGALLRTDGLTVAVFTDGREPARARQMRDWIAGFLSTVRPSEPQT